MFLYNLSILSILSILTNLPIISAFIPNANHVVLNEQINYNSILAIQKIPCHIQTSRIKSFESSRQKIEKQNKQLNNKIKDIYSLYDLIGFRYVFYNKEDLLKFYHHAKLDRKVLYSKNYIVDPKENGYSALHFRYINEYNDCPVKLLECQLFIIEDYYEAMYGKSAYDKNYTNFDFNFI